MNPISRQLALCVSLALFVLGAASCDRSETDADKAEVRELRILQPYVDGAEHDPFSRPRPTLHDILQQVWKASDDENVRGLLVRIGPLGGAWGSVGDLTEALDRFRGEARPVHCHLETADNVAYLLLASACDRISMSPAGVLDLVGPAAVMIYARSFLEKIGVQAEILHMGRYKGAGDMFIRDDMPPEAKESMDAILDDLYGSLVAATSKRVDGDTDKAKALIDAGPYVSSAAAEAGLIDSVEFLGAAREEIKKAASVDTVRRMRMVPQQDKLTVGQFLDLLSGHHDEPSAGGERVALVFVTGNIVEAERTTMGDAASGPFIREMERLAKDDNVKAVVLRINSPGGSALASDRMWQAAHQVAESKPLIASVGDMAASGGYYIASAANEILAHPDSLVGSIGVVGGKFNFEGLATELGVNTFVLQRGKRAAWSTPVRGLTPTERQAFEALLRDTYDRFIARVAEGREMERDKVLAAAEGRVLTAQDARVLGLVDEMAGLSDALAKARAGGGLGPDSEVEVWPSSKGILDAINEIFGENGDDEVGLLTELWLRKHTRLEPWLPLETWRDALVVLGQEHVALVPPFFFSLR
ncbi:MAG: signal peptide peptidase SppA [Myxococcales bacterium]|nr:signal peptide peptidase SppA [Myxococcales bacterium]MDH3483573.1 signal peptide peptidase SppA [Myxococcales bacterium]